MESMELNLISSRLCLLVRDFFMALDWAFLGDTTMGCLLDFLFLADDCFIDLFCNFCLLLSSLSNEGNEVVVLSKDL